MQKLILRLHGVPSWSRDDGPPTALSGREAALLGWLWAQGPTHRSVIAGRLWSESDEARARASLRQVILRLRRAVPGLIDDLDGVLALGPGVQVLAPQGERFLGALEFDDAPELAEWLSSKRDVDRRGATREGLVRARLSLDGGDLDAALGEADAILAADPLVEEAHRLRMRVFHLRQDKAAAIQAWDDCKLALRSALGIAPSAATNALGAFIAAGQAGPLPAALPGERGELQRLVQPAAGALVGRSTQLAHARAALLARRWVLVQGVGGSGKSAFIDAIAADRQPFLQFRGRLGDQNVPGAVLARAMVELEAKLGIEAGPARAAVPSFETHAEHLRWIRRIASELEAACERGLQLVVVDDLQLIDDLTVQVLIELAERRRQGAHGPPLLITHRPQPGSQAAQDLLAHIARGNLALPLALAPLEPAQVGALLAALPLPDALVDGGKPVPGLAEAIYARVGGNPANVVEAVKTLWHAVGQGWAVGQELPLPPSLLGQIRLRLDQLSAEARQLVQLAALAASDFSLAMAAESLGRPPLGLAALFEELEQAGVYAQQSFPHDLVMEAVVESLPGALKTHLHGFVAGCLERSGASPVAIARHFELAQNVAKAADWHLKAGDFAGAQWQAELAARSYQSAAQLLQALPAERARTLAAWQSAARWWSNLSRRDEALRAYRGAAALARTPVERTLVGGGELQVLLNGNMLDEVRAAFPAVMAHFQAAAPALRDRELARVLGFLAISARCHGGGGALSQLFAAHADRIADMEDPSARLVAQVAQGLLSLELAEFGAAHRVLKAALAEAARLGAHGIAINAAQGLVRASLELGRLADARFALALLREALAATEVGPSFRADAELAAGLVQMAAQCPADALVAFEAARCQAEEQGLALLPLATAGCTLALLGLGRIDAALAQAARVALPATGPSRDAMLCAWSLAQVKTAAGLGEQGLLARAWALDPVAEPRSLHHRVLAAGLARAPYAAQRALCDEAERRQLDPVRRLAHRHAAEAAAAAGQATEAARHRQLAGAIEAAHPWLDVLPGR